MKSITNNLKKTALRLAKPIWHATLKSAHITLPALAEIEVNAEHLIIKLIVLFMGIYEFVTQLHSEWNHVQLVPVPQRSHRMHHVLRRGAKH